MIDTMQRGIYESTHTVKELKETEILGSEDLINSTEN
jgi:hypothetical protein